MSAPNHVQPRPHVGAIFAFVAALGLTSCAESGPVTVRVFGQDPATGQYGELDAHLHSLDDVFEMRGDTVRFVGNATLVADVLEAQQDPKGGRILRAEGGMPPACSFSERDGVLHADDYDSLNMASAYFALERARDLFLDLGVDEALLPPLNAYYHPRIQLATKLVPTFWFLTDNAAYAPGFDGFLIVPHIAMPGTPFTANQGVMTHEYSHRVFNRLVEHGEPVQAWLKHDWSPSAARQFRSVDEGVADIFGFLATGDPDYIRASLGGEVFDHIDRDLRKFRALSDGEVSVILRPDDQPENSLSFDPHELGATIASALWRFGEDIGDHRRVALLVVEVQRELGDAIAATPQYDFSTLEFLDRVASKVAGDERAILCAIYEKRFQALIVRDDDHALESCP